MANTKRCAIDHAALKQDAALWSTLRYVGIQRLEADAEGPALTLELRDCICGSTLCKEMAS